MTVYHEDVPAECRKLLVKRRGIVNLCDGTVYLETVVVKEDTEIVELLVSGEHSRLPYLPLLGFAVAEHRIYAVAVARDLCGECHSACCGEAETERAGRHINTGCALHIGVALEIAVYAAEGLKILTREVSSLRKCCIESGSGVSLGEDKAVAIRLLRVAGINIHLLKVKI